MIIGDGRYIHVKQAQWDGSYHDFNNFQTCLSVNISYINPASALLVHYISFVN